MRSTQRRSINRLPKYSEHFRRMGELPLDWQRGKLQLGTVTAYKYLSGLTDDVSIIAVVSYGNLTGVTAPAV